MHKCGQLEVRSKEETWVPRESTKLNLGRSMVSEGFQEEVVLELWLEGCVGVRPAGK